MNVTVHFMFVVIKISTVIRAYLLYLFFFFSFLLLLFFIFFFIIFFIYVSLTYIIASSVFNNSDSYRHE